MFGKKTQVYRITTFLPRISSGYLWILLVACTFSAREGLAHSILRLDSGMHTAEIWRLDVDLAERWLVTASADHTARVWDLKTGELFTTLRPHIGENAKPNEPSPVAISPDGRTVALGGWSGYAWRGGYSIFLFDRASGRLVQRLSGLTSSIGHLAFSPDGTYLAATLAAKNEGVHVYRSGDWKELFVDKDYEAESYWADFSTNGQLITSCNDGYVRLYQVISGRLIKKIKPAGGFSPYAVAFSPDHQKIAVGFVDTTMVELLSATNLTFLYAPETKDVQGNLASVAWSKDGQWLYAGGLHGADGKRLIRRWETAGSGKYQDFPASNNTLLDLHAINGKRVIFGAGDPAWGVMDETGKIELQHTPAHVDFFGGAEYFRLSRDGRRLSFSMEAGGNQLVLFDLATRTLSNMSLPDTTLTAPRVQASSLKITDWYHSDAPRCNGQLLKLWQQEQPHSLAISPDESGFLLGTNRFLRYFDRNGKLHWKQPASGTAWMVNISGDGRLAMAGYGNGTLHWYRMKDGEKILSLFVHRDSQRWIAWTSKGYYLASPGGDELLGWHINMGKDQAADFFPMARFQNKYARYDIVSTILDTLDENEAIRLSNEERDDKIPLAKPEKMLPPVVSLLSPIDEAIFSSPRVTIRYRIHTNDGTPTTTLKYLVDGRPPDREKNIHQVRPNAMETIQLTLPPRDVTVSLFAENGYGVGKPSNIRWKWRGSNKQFQAKSNLYVLAIGISNYQNESMRPIYPSKDAQYVAAIMDKQQGNLYQEVETKLLPNATKNQILEGLAWLKRKTTANDVAMLFLAGHGLNGPKGTYYFIPSDAMPNHMKDSAIDYVVFKNTLINLPGKVVVFLDTRRFEEGMDVDAIANDLAKAENGVIVFSSSTGQQYSMEDIVWGHSVFTKALGEGLTQAHSNTSDGQITIRQLGLFVFERVQKLTRGKQISLFVMPNTIRDFPIATVQSKNR